MINSVDPYLASTFMTHFETKQQLKDWVHVFLGLDLPDTFIDPDSNSSPIDWMFETYQIYKKNLGGKIPSVIVVSSRESYKTLTESIWGIIAMVHFKASLAHMAAIVPQATAAQKYIQSFLRKIEKYTAYHGLNQTSSNAKEIVIKHPDGTDAYMKIIVCTLTGANSSHTNLMCIAGKTNIFIRDKNPNSNRDRIKINASKLFSRLSNGEQIEILSFNHETGKMEFKLIKNWFNNGKKALVDITLQSGKKVTTTPDHKFFNGEEYQEAQELLHKNVYFLNRVKSFEQDDKYSTTINVPIIKYQEPTHQNEFEQLLIGGLLGDMSVYTRHYPKSKEQYGNPMIYFNHGIGQRQYADWKANLLQKFLPIVPTNVISGYTNKPIVGYRSSHVALLKPWGNFRSCFFNLDHIEALGLAIWFMDDGSMSSGGFRLHTESFTIEQQIQLKEILFSKFDITVTISSFAKKDGRQFNYLSGSVTEGYKLYQIISKYLLPSMEYKFKDLLTKSIKKCHNCESKFLAKLTSNRALYCGNETCQAVRNKILKKDTIINIAPAKYNRSVYDFTVPDNHNYFANGILVHNCIDEIDTIRSAEGVRAYKEASLIPGVFDGQFPLTVKTSTMKFPGGLFSKELELAKSKKWPIYRWNLLDITEHCKAERCLPDEPKEFRYVGLSLPLTIIEQDEYGRMLEKDQANYEHVELMKGCINCQLAPVCRGRLHGRKPEDHGGLWKPIDFTITQFEKTDPDMAEAQLLCWKPSSQGMVYPRFIDKEDGTGNTYTLEQAWEVYTGTIPVKKVSHDQLIKEMVKNGIRFYCGVDWGSTHAFAISVGAIMPNKEFWIVDSYSVPGLEFAQMMDLAESVRDMYNRPHSWFCDTSAPMFIKEFKKSKMPCPKFTKDVMGGISCIRTQIVNGKGHRSLKVIKSEKTQTALKMFAEHCFKLDTIGNPTQDPDDGEFADFGDSLRYMGQCLFKPKSKNYVAQDYEPKQTPFQELTAAHLETRPDPSSFIVDSDLLTDFGA